jgi:hypothetical protein
MPVRTLPRQEKQRLISLDYDGIRLVYPNNTFGPGFGSAATNKEKARGDTKGETQKRSQYDVLSLLDPEVYRKLKQAINSENRDDGRSLIAVEDLQKIASKDLQKIASKDLQKIASKDLPDDATLETNLMRDMKTSLEYVHSRYFQDTPECYARLDREISSIDPGRITSITQLMIVLQRQCRSRGKLEAFAEYMESVERVVTFYFNALYDYSYFLGDKELTFYMVMLQKYMYDYHNKTYLDERGLYTRMVLIMHNLNLTESLLRRFAVKYRTRIHVPESQILSIVTFMKHLFVMSSSGNRIGIEDHKRIFLNIMVNLQVLFFFVKATHQPEVENYIFKYRVNQSEIARLGRIASDPSQPEEERERAADMVQLLTRQNEEIIAEQREKEEVVRSDGVKVYFWKQSRFSNLLVDAYDTVLRSRERQQGAFGHVRPSVGNLGTLGIQYANGTSNGLRFKPDENDSNEDLLYVLGASKRIIQGYIRLMVTAGRSFLHDIHDLFSPKKGDGPEMVAKLNSGLARLLERLPFFADPYAGVDDFVDEQYAIFMTNPAKFIDTMQKYIFKDYFLFSFITYTGGKRYEQKWSNLIKFLKEILPRDPHLPNAIYQNKFHLVRSALFALRAFQNVKMDDTNESIFEKLHVIDTYQVYLGNLRPDIDVMAFMDKLMHFIRYETDSPGIFDDEQSLLRERALYSMLDSIDDDLFRNPLTNMDALVNSIHLIDYEVVSDDGPPQMVINLGLNNKNAVFLLNYVLYGKRFPEFAASGRISHPKILRARPRSVNATGPPPHYDRFTFYESEGRPAQYTLDVYLARSHQEDYDAQTVQVTADTFSMLRLSYMQAKLLEHTCGSFSTLLHHLHRVPTWDVRAGALAKPDNERVLAMKKNEYLFDFHFNLFKSSLCKTSRFYDHEDPYDLNTGAFRIMEDTLQDILERTHSDIYDISKGVSEAGNPFTRHLRTEHVNEAILEETYLTMAHTVSNEYRLYSSARQGGFDIPPLVDDVIDALVDRNAEYRECLPGDTLSHDEFELMERCTGNIAKHDTMAEYYTACARGA